jgi:hypothetical protein
VSSAPLAPSGDSLVAPPPAASPASLEARPATIALPRAGARVRGALVALGVSVLIVAWQLDFNVNVPAPHTDHAITASTGLLPDLRYFFYFYHHLGLFPVGARDVPRLGPTREDALDFVARNGRNLRMDFGDTFNTPRFGDYGKLFTLWPDVLLRGDPARPSAMPFNQLMFITALLAVWWAFWRERRVLLGALIVVLIGSNPFQLYETYGRANIFSLPISVALIALAVHLPYLTGRRGLDRWAWAIALASGVALATMREIRTEAAIIALALVATYLSTRASWPRRAALALVFIAAWGMTGQAWTTYWSRGFERSARFVERAGGYVFPGRHSFNHALWHAVYCGLGDFGGDKGFVWDDRAAFRWATTQHPVTNPRPLPYHYRDGYYLEETYDGVSHIAPTDLPEYNQLVRDRVVSVIRADPLWYAGILLKRAGAVLGQATPAALTVGVTQWRLPGVGWALIPILVLSCFLRRTFEVKLILFMLPLSIVALAVYSGRGMTYYGIAHLLALAVAIDLLVRARRAQAIERRDHAR